MTEERCEQTDLLKTDCAHCRASTDKGFQAWYDGTCVTCHLPYPVGTPIRDRGDGGYEHARHR